MTAFDSAACARIVDAATALCVEAARAIRAAGPNDVRRKADGSPVTAADETAEAIIRAGLSRAFPGVPIVSEEQTEQPPSIGADESYFLVDPLDGTREFIAGRDEYTINIAMLRSGAPILGVIAAPAIGLIWRGIVGHGAERLALSADGATSEPRPVRTRARPHQPAVVVSRSYLDADTKAYLARLTQPTTLASGSAVKFCRVAEGSADLYPRLGPTHDWDVAAGHAIVEAAGGTVRAPNGTALCYGTAERIIPGFIAAGDASASSGA